MIHNLKLALRMIDFKRRLNPDDVTLLQEACAEHHGESNLRRPAELVPFLEFVVKLNSTGVPRDHKAGCLRYLRAMKGYLRS